MADVSTHFVSGRIKRRGWTVQFDNPEFQRDDGDTAVLHAGRIVPVYRLEIDDFHGESTLQLVLEHV